MNEHIISRLRELQAEVFADRSSPERHGVESYDSQLSALGAEIDQCEEALNRAQTYYAAAEQEVLQVLKKIDNADPDDDTSTLISSLPDLLAKAESAAVGCGKRGKAVFGAASRYKYRLNDLILDADSLSMQAYREGLIEHYREAQITLVAALMVASEDLAACRSLAFDLARSYTRTDPPRESRIIHAQSALPINALSQVLRGARDLASVPIVAGEEGAGLDPVTHAVIRQSGHVYSAQAL